MSAATIDLSCVVKTEEQSTLAAQDKVMASRPRLIAYVVNNVERATEAEFGPSVSGIP